MDEIQARFKLRKIWRMLRAGFDFLIPPRCMGCGTLGTVWCECCDEQVLKPRGARCPVCGLPWLFKKCPGCEQGLNSLRVEAIAAYQSPLSDALVAFKYRPDLGFADHLASWARELMTRLSWKPEIIVPVPLSNVRYRQRGYNQVELITSSLARSTSILHGSSTLQRVRDTRSQVGLDPHGRFRNMERAFTVEPDVLKAREILLVDDLLTTGATLLACSLALFEAGAETVHAMAIARA